MQLRKRASARLRHLFGLQLTNDHEITKDIASYGLGNLRSLAAYESFADVDLRRKQIGIRATDGRFGAAPPTTGGQVAVQNCFVDIYKNNKWNSFETRSGPGSVVSVTAELRQLLRETLRTLGVRTLVDAGCGDLNWNASVTTELDLYLGFDVVQELIVHNRIQFSQRKNHFFNTADICHDQLPRADAILCRNTLTHLTNRLVRTALKNLKHSEARYLLTTTFSDASNQDIETGQWRKIDLTAPPFALPPPLILLPDGDIKHNRFLGVWRLADW